MKKIALAAVVAFCCSPRIAHAQILKPVHWVFSAKKINAKEAIIFMKATIDDGWHVYSQFVKEGGPVKTSFTFDPSKDFTLAGATREPKPIVRKEKVFDDMEIGFFEHAVIFQQKVTLKAARATVSGHLEYMTCNDTKCLPPVDMDFSIPVK